MKNGVFLYEKYPIILSSRPVITSLREGPVIGTLIMGKYLDDLEFVQLSNKLQLQTSFHCIIDNAELPSLDHSTIPEAVYINIIRPSNDWIEGYGFIKGLTGSQSLGIKVDLPREIFKQGKSTITTFNRVYFGTALFYIVVIMAVFQKTVLSRILSLSSSVKSIRDSDDLTKKVEMKGNDEISELGDEFNRLLSGLDSSLKELKTYSESLEVLVDEKTKELLESERLAAIGKTVSMVGHDVRNPLMAITNAAYLLKKGSDQETIHSMINIIDKSAKYINQIFEDLTGHLQVNPLNRNYQSIDSLITDILSMTLIPNSITVNLSLDPIEGYLDDVKFRRVLSNLIRNSIEAMPEEGILDISCTSESQTIYIKMVDSGGGIHADILSKVYTPFFTTKQNGLGLGLSYAKQVVEEHGGSINIISQVDVGTDITIKLPLEQDL